MIDKILDISTYIVSLTVIIKIFFISRVFKLCVKSLLNYKILIVKVSDEAQ